MKFGLLGTKSANMLRDAKPGQTIFIHVHQYNHSTHIL